MVPCATTDAVSSSRAIGVPARMSFLVEGVAVMDWASMLRYELRTDRRYHARRRGKLEPFCPRGFFTASPPVNL